MTADDPTKDMTPPWRYIESYNGTMAPRFVARLMTVEPRPSEEQARELLRFSVPTEER